VSGQLERQRWVARIAGLVGAFFFIACWTTKWTVPAAQLVPSGMYYVSPGPLTGLHISQLVLWLGVGLVIVRRSTPRGEQARVLRLVLGVLVMGAIGSIDTLLLYRVWGLYPIAWLPATIAAGIALYLVLRTDLLRPQGFDAGVALELGAFTLSVAAAGVFALLLPEATAPALAAAGSAVWAILTGISWSFSKSRPVRVAGERALEQFVGRIGTVDDPKKLAEHLSALWDKTVRVAVKRVWWLDASDLVAIDGSARWPIDPAVVKWLVRLDDALARTDLATMRLGALRGPLEKVVAAHDASLLVPLVDRDELVGLVEADTEHALRVEDRRLVLESARAAARALTYIGMARAAVRERETAREVEIADALRQQAASSRDAELGKWAVTAEYRSAPRTTGAGWSAVELADGRLALLATEAQAHGVAAALATAALTGAFAAATRGDVTLADILASMQASADGVMRGGEPVAAFIAIVDSDSVEWACAGHPGAHLVGPIALVDAGLPDGSTKGTRPNATPLGGGQQQSPGASLQVATRGKTPLPPDTLLVVASTGLRGPDDGRYQDTLRMTAHASGRLATALVENALRRGDPAEDLLAVVVRSR
jgi:hypothetical protein